LAYAGCGSNRDFHGKVMSMDNKKKMILALKFALWCWIFSFMCSVNELAGVISTGSVLLLVFQFIGIGFVSYFLGKKL
jgi:hypothetical protein